MNDLNENIFCQTEPNDMLDNDLGDFYLPDDNEELLTENLSPVRDQARQNSGKFMFPGPGPFSSHEKNDKINANSTAPLKTLFGNELFNSQPDFLRRGTVQTKRTEDLVSDQAL